MLERVTFAYLTISACDVEFGFLTLSDSMSDIDSSSLSVRYSGCSVCSFAFHLPPFGVARDPDGRWIDRHIDSKVEGQPRTSFSGYRNEKWFSVLRKKWRK
jgi:hypothetical protein